MRALPTRRSCLLYTSDVYKRQIYEKGAVVVDSLTTAGDDSSVTTDALWPGMYEIVELAPPVGYQAAVDSIIVDARSAAEQSHEAVVIYEGVVTNEIRYGAQAIDVYKRQGSRATAGWRTRKQGK